MRPELLVIEGFGAFRDRVEIDFTGIDFFALVGPTGSGKSTVIDAICFALYGSVPRYNDERLVAPIISTGAVEARVSLRFTAGGSSYAATRVARRTPKGATTKEARLERHKGDGSVEAVAASANDVSAGVQALLGLSFAHFTRCVVLPQGEFAKFLHDKPAERQEVLVKLLELDVYRKMMQAANARAVKAVAAQQAIAAVINELGDLTDGTLTTARQKHHRLDTLRLWLGGVNEAIAEIRARGIVAGEQEKTLSAQIAAVDGLTMPADVAEVAARLEGSNTALKRAEAQLAAAVAKVEAARVDVAALPTLDALQVVIRDHNDLANVSNELLDVRSRLADAAAAVESATQMVASTGGEMATLTGTLEPIHDLEVAEAAHHSLSELRARLAANEPLTKQAAESFGELSARRGELEQEVGQLTPIASRVTVLSRLVETHREFAARSEKLRFAQRDAEAKEASADQLGAALLIASNARVRAQDELIAIERANTAAAIAVTLRVGDECPVCHHEVTGTVAHSAVPELHEGQDTLKRTIADEAAAKQSHDAAVKAAVMVRAEAGAHEARCIELQGELRKLADSLDSGALADNAASAEAALSSATTAENDLDRVTAEQAEVSGKHASVGLRLAELTTEANGWREQSSRFAEVVDRYPDLPALQRRMEHARQTQAAVGRLEAALLVARQSETECKTAHAGLAARSESLVAQRATLEARCADHPSMPEALAKREALDAAIAARTEAVAEMQAVSDLCARIKIVVGECVDAESAAKVDFQRARDGVALLSPPAVTDALIAEQWGAFMAWAASKWENLKAGHTEIQGVIAELREELVVKRTERVERLGEVLELAIAVETPEVELDRLATTAINATQVEIKRIQDGRQRTADLRSEEAALNGQAEVARKLGQLLSAKQFEQWLVATALQSLTSAASEILERLSGHEFGLESTDSNDFLVIDHHNADERRPVRSLSGGETFQASLALALALSQELGGLTAQPGRSLDSIFLDEGFGTLDPDTLDSVAGTIESLGNDGRMVGIITHVRELADRVPVRFRVTKGERTSTIEMEGL